MTFCALRRAPQETVLSWDWNIFRTIAPARRCPGRKRTKRPGLANCFPKGWKDGLARRALRIKLSSNATGIWRLRKTICQAWAFRSEEHTSELQSPMYLVCRLLLEKK